MELTEIDLDLLDRYIHSDVSDAEKITVEQRIALESSWKEAYALRMAAREASRQAFHASMRQRFGKLDRGTGKIRAISPLWLAIAAAAVLIISALIWLFPDHSGRDVFAEYQAFPNVVFPIDKSADTISNQVQFYYFYEQKRYREAIAAFALLNEPAVSDQLYLGLSLLEDGQYAGAHRTLDKVIATDDARWKPVAEWYLVWTLLHQDRKTEAQNLLQAISASSGHRFRVEASELLRRLQ
jgi:tetratricopeptide (TPR) repeat protein